MDIVKQQELFLNRLYTIIPSDYILSYKWLSTIDWQQKMKQSFDLELDINKNLKIGLFPWENIETHAFLTYKDICNLSSVIKAEIKERIGDNLSCYLFFDFAQEGNFATTLKLNFVPEFIFDIGMTDISNGLYYSFEKMPFLIFSEKNKHCIWLEDIDRPIFTTFSLVSLTSNQRAAKIKKEIALMAYIEKHFSTYYEKSSIRFNQFSLGEDYFYEMESLADYVNTFLDNLCDFCLYDSKYELLRNSWSTSKKSRTKKEEKKRAEFESFVYHIYYLLSEMQTNISFKNLLLDESTKITLSEQIKNKKRSWHNMYMDGLGGPDYEDHFMIFSDIMEY